MSPKSETVINRVGRWYAKIGAPDDWEWGLFWNENWSGMGGTVGWGWGGSLDLYITQPSPRPYFSLPPSDEQPHGLEDGSGGNPAPDDSTAA